MVSYPQSFLGTNHLIPSAPNTDCHETSHSGTVQHFTEVLAWHIDVFAQVVEKLKNTPDVDGKTVLDNTAVVYLFEGGYGADPQLGSSGSAHSSENMVAFAAGRAAGNSPGVHIEANGLHPASTVFTAMKNIGMTHTNLGDITTTVPGLLL